MLFLTTLKNGAARNLSVREVIAEENKAMLMDSFLDYWRIMEQHSLAAETTRSFASHESIESDVTIVMPFYDRTKYFHHYLREGLWDGFRIQLVCDGSPEEVLNTVGDMSQQYHDISVHRYPGNKGVAFARSTGVQLIRTPYLLFCDDDDFLVEGNYFMDEAASSMNEDDEILFSAMREVFAFDESMNAKRQYDRLMFHGITARELLTFMVYSGEICVLSLGTVFRSEELKGVMPESFFRVSEDYVFLARLCARFPDRRIEIVERGGYMRLTQHNSLSARNNYSLDKIVMHYVSMFVGAYHLMELGDLQIETFQQILIQRGLVLQSSYNKGAEVGKLMAHLLNAGGVSSSLPEGEPRNALRFLKDQKGNLPAEFNDLVGW